MRTPGLRAAAAAAFLLAAAACQRPDCGDLPPDGAADIADGAPDAPGEDTPADGDAPGDSADADAGPGAEGLRSVGGFLRDASGRAVILRGALWPDIVWAWETSPRPRFEASDAARLRGWGFNHLRLFFRWAYLEPSPGGWSDEYMAAIEDTIRVAEENGLYVVLEMDQADWAPCFPRESERCLVSADCSRDRPCVDGICSPAKRGHGLPDWLCLGAYPGTFAGKDQSVDDFWTRAPDPLDPAIAAQDRLTDLWVRIAERLAGHPLVGYAPLNEPPIGTLDQYTVEEEYLYPYWTRLAAAIRAADPDAIFFYPPFWALYTHAEAGPILVPNRAYGVHFYPPGPDGRVSGCVSFPASVADLEADLVLGVDAAAARDEPLWVGEWGVCTQTPTGPWMDARAYAEVVGLEFDVRLASHAYFVYAADDSYGILDSAGVEKPDLIRSLDRAYPLATAGTPLLLTFDVTTPLFTLVFLQEPGIAGDTVVYVPERHFPGGFETLSTDPPGSWSWEWDETSRLLHVRADPRSTLHFVAVQPAGGILADECDTAADCPGTGCYRLEPFGVDLCADECRGDSDCGGLHCAGAKLAELIGSSGHCVETCTADSECDAGWSCVRFGPGSTCRRRP